MEHEPKPESTPRRGFRVSRELARLVGRKGGWQESHDMLSPTDAEQRFRMLKGLAEQALSDDDSESALHHYSQMDMMGLQRHDNHMRVEANTLAAELLEVIGRPDDAAKKRELAEEFADPEGSHE